MPCNPETIPYMDDDETFATLGPADFNALVDCIYSSPYTDYLSRLSRLKSLGAVLLSRVSERSAAITGADIDKVVNAFLRNRMPGPDGDFLRNASRIKKTSQAYGVLMRILRNHELNTFANEAGRHTENVVQEIRARAPQGPPSPYEEIVISERLAFHWEALDEAIPTLTGPLQKRKNSPVFHGAEKTRTLRSYLDLLVGIDEDRADGEEIERRRTVWKRDVLSKVFSKTVDISGAPCERTAMNFTDFLRYWEDKKLRMRLKLLKALGAENLGFLTSGECERVRMKLTLPKHPRRKSP